MQHGQEKGAGISGLVFIAPINEFPSLGPSQPTHTKETLLKTVAAASLHPLVPLSLKMYLVSIQMGDLPNRKQFTKGASTERNESAGQREEQSLVLKASSTDTHEASLKDTH